MSEPLTDAEIAELRKLDAEATPPPWEWHDEEDQVRGPRTEPKVDETDPDYSRIVETDSGYYPPHGADRYLIPAVRNALPRLLDELEKLRRLTRYSAMIKNVGPERGTVLLVGAPLPVKPIKE